MSCIYNQYDLDAAKILDSFLPQEIFDSHMHISEFPFCGKDRFGFSEYYNDIAPLFSGRRIRCNALATPTAALKGEEGHLSTLSFFKRQLDEYTDNVGSILVKPGESLEEIESHIVHKNIRGFKCYHSYSGRPDTTNASIDEYLPEAALDLANRRKMTITIHMVKEHSLADPDNLNKIKNIAKRYPDLTLILAHAARAFAQWTAIETVGELSGYENVWYDFSAICESPAMMQIIKKIGVSRCMWGSDYNVCMLSGKPISIADSFYWIGQKDIESFLAKGNLHTWRVITENLMAVRQASQILDLTAKDVEDIFYNNAARLFG